MSISRSYWISSIAAVLLVLGCDPADGNRGNVSYSDTVGVGGDQNCQEGFHRLEGSLVFDPAGKVGKAS